MIKKRKTKKKKYGIQYGLITSALRLIWMKSAERNDAVQRSKRRLINPKTNKLKQFPTCEKCGKVFYDEKGYAVHHINPVGSISAGADNFIKRLFCPTEELIVLCQDCHDKIHGRNQKK